MSSRGTMRPDRRLGAIAIACLVAVGAALVSQHRFGMQPCPWCILQRVIFLAIAAACVIGLVWRSASGRALAGALAFVLALAGVAAALWQHFYAAVSASCNQTLADKIVNGLGLDALVPDVFAARASCADSAVILFGISYELWSLALFALIGLTALSMLLGRRGR